MENHQSDATFLAQALIRIDSTDPGAYEKNIGDYIFNWLTSLSVPILKKEVLPGRYNIMAKIQGEIDDPALVYICHMDTVTIGEGWTTDPFGAEVIQGKIYGRGACDMKSGLACALSVFSAMAKEAASGKIPKHSFVFIGTVDEEDFMRGVEDAIKEGWVSEKSFVLDTEPTNGQIQVAHKGRTWFEIEVTGVTAHASTPWKGADAIAAMAEIISSIRRKVGECPSHQDLGASTVTFGQIEGGYRPYVVPDRCKVWIDMRLVPPTDTASAVSIVEQAIRDAAQAVPGITASYAITGDRPYIEKDEASPLLKALKAAAEEVTGEPVPVTFFPGYTDTAVIAGKLHNHNCMSYGPGDLELAHKPDEFVPCEDILRCEKVLTRLARSFLF
ncbi:M20 family metallopeptidase [Lacrimispora saccharolytica]|uniref:Peptidase M20 n=1 Tax=Lacrimispora saccharolytica (strain ATCC 35040 / DSM 2544 / NRCC 2533 / WM1) TaxID=610130 RepID=D9R594_LACSW|nr:M20 family metallopeptidase [Lacrimispora saccharolytica]ADL03300.1 peptidase M20 [[Clostridium] saccharolyticum WM1]QRV18536.1 M20 family metallopeptidase [Lacrimispora saccharolytica]